MKMYVADKETGTFIEEVDSIDDGMKIIRKYEEEDLKENTYTPDFYDIVDEEHCSILH